MDLHEYQQLATRTAGKYDSLDLTLAVFALGLTGEAGEVAEHIKKAVGHGHELSREHVAKELGDVLWYLAALADALGLQLADVAQGNIAKLRARYPEGFSHAASINRAE